MVAGVHLGALRGVVAVFLAAISYDIFNRVILGVGGLELLTFIGGPFAAFLSGYWFQGRRTGSVVHVFVAALLGTITILFIAILNTYVWYGVAFFSRGQITFSGLSVSAVLVPILSTVTVLAIGRLRQRQIILSSHEYK